MRINWRIVSGIAVSLIALAIILKNVSLNLLVQALATANYWWMLPSVIILLIATYARGVRWRALLDNRISISRSFWISNAGNLLNNVLPLRLGEFGRAYLASRNSELSSMQSLSAVLIERLLDVLSVFAMLLVVLPFVPQEGTLVRAGMALAAFAFTGVVALFLAAAARQRVMVLADKLLGWLTPAMRAALVHRADDFLRGVSAAGGRRLVAGVLWSALVWACYGAATYIFLLAFYPQAQWYAGFFVTCAMALGLSIPSSPSGAGLYEAAAVAGLAVFGVPADVALAFALVLHIATFVLIAILGTIGLDREGESFKHLTASAQAMLAAARSE